MPSREVALRALHAKVDFEVVDAAGALAAATSRRGDAERRSEQARARCETLLAELRRLHGVPAINPAALDAVRRSYRNAVRHREQSLKETAEAAGSEQAHREALAALRERARHLDDALGEDAAARAKVRAVREHATLDDLWLAQTQARGAR